MFAIRVKSLIYNDYYSGMGVAMLYLKKGARGFKT